MSIEKFKIIFANANDLQDGYEILKELLTRYNIRTFAFTYYAYHPHSKNKLKYDCCSVNWKRWHQHYIEEGYETIDTTLSNVYQDSLPIMWDLKTQLKEAKNERERQMRLDGITFGADKGISIPIHGPNDDFAVFLLVQMKNENCLENWGNIQDELMLLAQAYYQFVKRLLILNVSHSNQYQLNNRELQCILLTAKKRSVHEIANFLKIKERTVNFHIQNANKKMGVQNKYQSVAKAIEKGIIVL